MAMLQPGSSRGGCSSPEICIEMIHTPTVQYVGTVVERDGRLGGWHVGNNDFFSLIVDLTQLVTFRKKINCNLEEEYKEVYDIFEFVKPLGNFSLTKPEEILQNCAKTVVFYSQSIWHERIEYFLKISICTVEVPFYF